MANPNANLADVKRGLSAQRLQPYADACRGDLAAALMLYRWNARMAAAFWTDLAHAEVFLRNALVKQLAAWVPRGPGVPWYNALGATLSPEALRCIDKAKRRVQADGHQIEPCRVVAAFSFGFWRFLLSSRYDRSLWRPCLHRAFPHHRPARRVIHDTLHRLHHLRNRIAHHEPIHNRDLKALYDDLLTAVTWIDPAARSWIDTGSIVPKTLSCRPVHTGRC